MFLPCLAVACKPDIIGFRKAYGETQTITIRLSKNATAALLKEERIRVGWVACRTRNRNNPRRCYWFLLFGHMAHQ